MGLIKKFFDADILKKGQALNAVIPYVTTNVSSTEMISLGLNINNFCDFSNLKELRIPEYGKFKETNTGGYFELTDFINQKPSLHQFIWGRTDTITSDHTIDYSKFKIVTY
jgi:hypothetical protein